MCLINGKTSYTRYAIISICFDSLIDGVVGEKATDRLIFLCPTADYLADHMLELSVEHIRQIKLIYMSNWVRDN